jgi:hypothetical protein
VYPALAHLYCWNLYASDTSLVLLAVGRPPKSYFARDEVDMSVYGIAPLMAHLHSLGHSPDSLDLTNILVDRRGRPLVLRRKFVTDRQLEDRKAFGDRVKSPNSRHRTIESSQNNFAEIVRYLKGNVNLQDYKREFDSQRPESDAQLELRRIGSILASPSFQQSLDSDQTGTVNPLSLFATAQHIFTSDATNLKSRVLRCLEKDERHLRPGRFIHADPECAKAANRFYEAALEGSREAAFHFGRMLLIDRQDEA